MGYEDSPTTNTDYVAWPLKTTEHHVSNFREVGRYQSRILCTQVNIFNLFPRGTQNAWASAKIQ